MAQATIGEARELIAKVWGDDPGVAIANAVLDHIEEARPERIGFGDVMRLGGREDLDEDVTRALAMLAQSRGAVLSSQFRFRDGEQLIPVPSFPLFAPYETSEFRHPLTGEVVPDYMDRVVVDFVVNDGIYGNEPKP